MTLLRRVVLTAGCLVVAESSALAQQLGVGQKQESKVVVTGPEPLPPDEAEAARRAEEVGPARDPNEEAARAIYVSGDIAYTRSDLGLIHDGLDFDRTGANGVLYGLAAGVRLKQWRFGLRWRVHDTTQFTLWSFALQAGYALKMRPVTPIFSAHLGYVFDQELQGSLFKSKLPDGNFIAPDVDVKGALLGVDVNAAYAVLPWLRVGAFVGADAMLLFRGHAPAPQSIYGPVDTTGDPLYSKAGNSVGLNVNAGFRGSFDIGIR